MRLAIASVLDWVGSWLSCIADHIGNPGVYDWHWPTPLELWRSFKIGWEMWHTDPDQIDDDWESPEDSEWWQEELESARDRQLT